MANKIQFGIGFDVDKSSLQPAIQQLQELQKLTRGDLIRINSSSLNEAEKDLKEITKAATDVEMALKAAFNPRLGIVDFQKFEQEIKKSYANAEDLRGALAKAGSQGLNAFNSLTSGVNGFNQQIKTSETILDKIGKTLGNTIRWNLSSSIVNQLSGSFQEAYGYVKHLDTALNDIRIVTNKSAEEMDVFAQKANTAAQALGKSTNDYTEAALIYAQQGLNDEDLAARTEVTLKAANVTQQSAAQVSEQLTAVWNGFQITAENTERSVDKLAAIAASTASDLEELSTGMSKVASAANAMGVSEDQLASMLSTVISVTRGAPESIGVAFKTIFARVSDIQQGLSDEFASLGNYSGKMAQFGIEILDANGKMRDMGDIIEDIGGKWETLTKEQQLNLAQTMAGQRQYSNLIALFDNWDMYTKSMDTAANSAGTLQKQQDIYMESTAAHLEQMKAALENVYDSFLDTGTINNFADAIKNVANVFAGFLDSIGGGTGLLLNLGGIGLRVFKDQISTSITSVIKNMQDLHKLTQMQQTSFFNIEEVEKLGTVAEKINGYRSLLKNNINLFSSEEQQNLTAAINDLERYNNTLEEGIEISKQANEFTNVDKESEFFIDVEKIREGTIEVDKLKSAFSEAQAEAAKMNDDIQELFNGFDDAMDTPIQVIKSYLEENSRSTEQLQKDFDNMFEEMLKDSKNFENNLQGIFKDNYGVEFSKILDDYKKKLEELGNDPTIEQQINEYEKLIIKLKDLQKATVEAGQAQEDAFKRAGEAAEELSNAVSNSENSLKSLSDGFNITKVKNFTQGLIDVIGGLTQLAGGLESVKAGFEALSNQDLSVLEKTNRFLTGISTGLLQFATGLKPVIGGLKNFSKEMGEVKLNGATLKEILSQDVSVFEKLKQVLLGLGSVLKKTILPALGALLANPWTWVIAGTVAAIGAIVYKATEAQRELEKLQRQAKEAEESSKKLEEQVNESLSASKSYTEAINALDKLEKGSDEYAEALKKAKEEAERLLEIFPQLAAHIIDFKDGLPIIDPEAIERLTTLQQTASAGKEVQAVNKKNNVLEAEKNQLTIGGYTSDQTQKLIDSMGGVFSEATLEKAIKDNLDLFSRLESRQVYTGNGLQTQMVRVTPSAEEVKGKIDLEELKAISGKMDVIDSQIKANNESLTNHFRQSFSDWDEMSKGTQEAIKKAMERETSSEEYQQAYKDAESIYKGYSDELLKSVFEQAGGALSEEDQEKSNSEQRDIMVEYLANLGAYVDTINNVAENLSDILNKASEENKSLDNATGINGLGQEFVDFLSGETDIQITIPPEKKEEVLKAIDEMYSQGLSDNTKKLLEAVGVDSEEAVEKIKNDFRDKISNIDWSEATTGLKNALQEGLDEGNAGSISRKIAEDFHDNNEQIQKFTQLLNSSNLEGTPFAQSLDELDEKLKAGAISVDEYADAIEQLVTKESINEINEDFAKQIGFDAKDVEYLQTLADMVFEDAKNGVNDLNKEIAENPELLRQVTAEIARMQRGYDNLYDNAEKWIEAINNGGRDGIEAMSDLRAAMADILDLELSDINVDVLANNLDLVRAAAEGSEEAIWQLQEALYQATLQDIAIDLTLNDEQLYNQLSEWSGILQQYELDNNIEVGATINDEDFINALNKMIQNSGMTVDQVNSLLGSIGYEPIFTTQKEDLPNKQQAVSIETKLIRHEDTGEFSFTSPDGETISGKNVYTTWGQESTPRLETIEGSGIMTMLGFRGDGQAPEIKGIRKKASGGGASGASRPNSYKPSAPSSSNKGGGSGKKPSSGSGKKPSSGKGGGGSGTAKEAKQKDLIEEEIDRYHDIDIEIKNIERDLNRLGDAQKKLVGKDIIDSLNKQLDILNKQVDAYERKIAIAKGELAENRATLQQMGVTFDAEGQISNYSEAYLAALKKYNDAITAYNLMSAEEQEANGEAAIKAAEKEYEKFKEAISRYDELINDVIPDLQDSIQAAIDKQIEIEIEKFKMEVEVRLDMADAERKWNEFKRKVIDGIKDDDYLGIIKSQYADLLTYFNTADTGKGPIQALTEQLNGTLDQLKSMDGTLGDWATAYGDHQAQALEDLQEYLDKLMDQMMDVEDLIKDIEKTYLDMIKAIKDAFDEQLDNYKLIDDIIEHNKNVIGLLYGDKAYEQMAHYYDKQEQNNLQQLDFLRQEAAFWKEKMDAEEQGSEAWKQYKENWENALGNLNSKVEDSIKTLIDKYTNLIDDIFDKLNNKVSNGLGLDYVKDEWDLINKNADQYLDTINRAFETQKLQEKFNEALANTSGLKAQQQIKDLMDQQLGDLEQRDKLTQYDVERAEKMLDIELKKIALQDAQQNKSKMRLRRDAQGNYSYQFVSDEQKIADAQKELAAAQNELYNFDKDRYQNNLNQIYDTYNEFQEKLKELYANTALSDEERERQKTLLIQQYGELINGLTEQNAQIRLNLEKSAFTELAKMYNTNLDEFMAMTEEQRMALMEGLIPYWNSGIQQMVDTFAGEGGFIPTCTESFSQLEQATQDYVNSLNEIEAAAGINFDAIAQGYDKNIELAQELIVKNEELISQYDRELQAVQEVLSAVRDLAAAYASVKQNAIEASEAAMKYQQEEAKRKAEAAEEERKKQEAANKQQQQQQAASNSSGTKPNSGTPQTTTGKTGKAVSMSDVRIGAKFRYTGGIYYYTSTGAGPVGNRGPGGVVEVENIAPNAKYKVAVKSSNSAYGWLNVNQLEKLKSGGYTGNWSGSGLDNDGGRLALLHQKELVLNSTDTQNILDAVGVLRGLSDLLGARAITNLANTLKDIKTSFPLQNNKQEEILEQQVTITATFPNVKNSNEVEDAINNLINTAAQRRNRRGR